MSTTSKRQRIYSGGPYERKVGYARATRVGDQVFVSGTTAMRDGELAGKGDAAAQTRQILLTIQDALEQAGSLLDDVVRIRIFITNIVDWSEISPVISEAFSDIHPAATMVVVAGLIDPDLLVEIEADAIVGSATPVD